MSMPCSRWPGSGTEEQLESKVPKIVSGTWRVCLGVTEPNAGLTPCGSRRPPPRKRTARTGTTPLDRVEKPTICINVDRARSRLDMRRIRKLGGSAVDANEVFLENYAIPADSLVGEEGQGFRVILHGMNAERCLLASEALEEIAHPLAEAYMKLEGAKLATYHAARLYDQSVEDSSITSALVRLTYNSAK
ncbi:hypothetical protein VUR80DRAFT_9656 [Thermomyces stellatus]